MKRKAPEKPKRPARPAFHAVQEQEIQLDADRWSGFHDSFGERETGIDADGSPIELLRLVREFSAVEAEIAGRIAHLAAADHPGLARALRIEHDDHKRRPRPVLVSDRIAGVRLSEAIGRGISRTVVPDIGAALYVMRGLLTTAESLHAATGVAHFIIAPERVILTPRGGIVVTEAALAGATEAMPLLPKALRLALSSVNGLEAAHRVDIARIARIGLSMMLGRLLEPNETIDALSPALSEIDEVASIRAGDVFATALRTWIEQALTVDAVVSFRSFREAAEALARTNPPKDCAASRRTLRTFLNDLSLEDLRSPETTALDADRVHAIRARQTESRPAEPKHGLWDSLAPEFGLARRDEILQESLEEITAAPLDEPEEDLPETAPQPEVTQKPEAAQQLEAAQEEAGADEIDMSDAIASMAAEPPPDLNAGEERGVFDLSAATDEMPFESLEFASIPASVPVEQSPPEKEAAPGDAAAATPAADLVLRAVASRFGFLLREEHGKTKPELEWQPGGKTPEGIAPTTGEPQPTFYVSVADSRQEPAAVELDLLDEPRIMPAPIEWPAVVDAPASGGEDAPVLAEQEYEASEHQEAPDTGAGVPGAREAGPQPWTPPSIDTSKPAARTRQKGSWLRSVAKQFGMGDRAEEIEGENAVQSTEDPVAGEPAAEAQQASDAETERAVAEALALHIAEGARASVEAAARELADLEHAKAAEAEARRLAEAEDETRQVVEAAARRAAEAEAQRLAEDDARHLAEAQARAEARRLVAEEEAYYQAAELEARRQAAESEARRAAEEETRRLMAEAEERRRAEEDARRLAAEIEARRRAEEEAQRRAEAEARHRAEEEARSRAEAEARRLAAEAEARRLAEEEAERRAEAEARQRAEQEARRRAEEEARRLAAETEARRRADEEAQRRAEAEARQKAEQEARRRAEEDARRLAAEAEARRREAEESQRAEQNARRRAEDEARHAAAETEALRVAIAEAETRRLAVAEAETRRLAAEADRQAAAESETQRLIAAAARRPRDEDEESAEMSSASAPATPPPDAWQRTAMAAPPTPASQARHPDPVPPAQPAAVYEPAPTPTREWNRSSRLPEIAAAISQMLRSAALLVVAAGLVGGLGWAGYSYYSSKFVPGTVVIESNPTAAEILIDGAAKGVTPLTIDLAPGSHKLELRRLGNSRELTLDIAAGEQLRQQIDLTNLRAIGMLVVNSSPKGATVSIDGRERGVTPLTLSDLDVGAHSVLIESSAGSIQKNVLITAGGTITLDEGIFSGWIAVFAPFELQIYERKRLIGTTENERIMLSAGRHELEFVNARRGFRGSRVVEVGPGATVPINILESDTEGIVRIEAPAGTEVFIDGQRAGESPIDEQHVAVGAREILAKHPQLGEKKMTVTVTSGRPADVKIEFATQP